MLPCRFAIFAAAIAIGVAAIPSAAGGLLSNPMSFLVWWDSVGTASAAITIVHLFAITGFAYVAVVATLVAVADIFRLGALRHTVLRAATPSLRRTLTAGAFVAASAAAPAIADESSFIITDIGAAAPSITEIVLHDMGPVPVPPTAVPFESPGTNPAAPPADSTAPSTTGSWSVKPGDNLWVIAETVVAERSGTQTRGSVAAYWGALLEANADRLVDPDLIMPGQLLTLPPLTAGS
ncbi:MAG: LysM peptidoglycan-binding domain-containing protein [Acidimicrobiales bacterium]|nr:LysM peptidoglycan-binding domain-containing protein [Acidimicrobiales bacterium]